MAAYFIVDVKILNVNDRKQYDEYIKKVKPIVENFGGTYLVRSEQISTFAGEWNPDRLIVIEFATREQLDRCFSSNEYASIKGLREKSVLTNAIIVEQ